MAGRPHAASAVLRRRAGRSPRARAPFDCTTGPHGRKTACIPAIRVWTMAPVSRCWPRPHTGSMRGANARTRLEPTLNRCPGGRYRPSAGECRCAALARQRGDRLSTPVGWLSMPAGRGWSSGVYVRVWTLFHGRRCLHTADSGRETTHCECGVSFMGQITILAIDRLKRQISYYYDTMMIENLHTQIQRAANPAVEVGTTSI